VWSCRPTVWLCLTSRRTLFLTADKVRYHIFLIFIIHCKSIYHINKTNNLLDVNFFANTSACKEHSLANYISVQLQRTFQWWWRYYIFNVWLRYVCVLRIEYNWDARTCVLVCKNKYVRTDDAGEGKVEVEVEVEVEVRCISAAVPPTYVIILLVMLAFFIFWKL
jgi:hypothetical protein